MKLFIGLRKIWSTGRKFNRGRLKKLGGLRTQPTTRIGSAAEVLESRLFLTIFSGTVYHDFNQNGHQDAGEPGLQGLTVTANNNNSLIRTTDVNGNYEFDLGSAFEFELTVPTSWRQTNNTVNVTADASDAELSFGGDDPTAVAGGNFDINVEAGLVTDELVASSFAGNVIRFFDYNTSTQQWSITQSITAVSPGDLVVGDFTQDGAPDVASVQYLNSTNPGVNILVNNGSGAFSAPLFVPIPRLPGSLLDRPRAIATAQFNDDNNDGSIDEGDRLDLVVVSENDRKLSILLNQGVDGSGNPIFNVTSLNPAIVPSGSVALATGDFDGQSGSDIALLSNLYNSENVPIPVLSVYSNDGTGDFPGFPVSQNLTATANASSRAMSITAGDLVGDSLPDLAVAFGQQNVGVLHNSGGNFDGTSTIIPVGPAPVHVGLADLDGDSDLDLAIAHGYFNQTVLAVNLGNGEFFTSNFVGASIDDAVPPYVAALADWDGDGDRDWALPEEAGNEVSTRTSSPTPGPYSIADISSDLTNLDFGVVLEAALPAPGDYEVLRDGADIVVRAQGGAESFRQPVASVPLLTIQGTTGGDNVTVLNTGTAVDLPIVFHGYAGNDIFEGRVAAGQMTLNGGSGNDLLNGGLASDVISGSEGADTLDGFGGNDILDGGADSDTVRGGFGLDTVRGGQGNDIVRGGRDRDLLEGGNGNDALFGEDGFDTLRGGDDVDTLDGGAGNDSLNGGDGNDRLIGFAGRDTIHGSFGDDLLIGGADPDMLFGGLGQDTLRGDAGNDTLGGGDANDSLVGGLEDDSIFGGAGNDQIRGGQGNDTLNGGIGNDRIFGEDDHDRVDGNNGDDTLLGGNGSDTLLGDAGNDVVFGESGDDTVFGGTGRDEIFGDDGNDRLFGNDGYDTMSGGLGNDFIRGGRGQDQLSGDAGRDEIIGDEHNDTIRGGNDNDTLTTGSGADRVFAGTGNDVVDGGPDDDQLYGDAGNDTISGSTGRDLVRGGAGNDLLNGDGGFDTLFGDQGDDTIAGGDGNDTVFAGSGRDRVSGDVGNDRLFGNDGYDTMSGGLGNDFLRGGRGQDSLNGDQGNDEIIGDEHNDTLIGGSGSDRATGGSGADTIDVQEAPLADGIDSVIGSDMTDTVFTDPADLFI